jgi:predicted molibdopterin-dependent oxidoreductase YjgC
MFFAIEYKAPAEVVDEEYPLWLTTGRVFAHYHTGTMTRRAQALHCEIPEAILEVHPADAGKIGIRTGDSVHLTTRRGKIQVKIQLTDRIKESIVFMPFHFVEANANVLTNTALDPIAKIPELKVCAVRLEKVQ